MTDKELEFFKELANPPLRCITLWYRLNKKTKLFEYNHFEYGIEIFCNFKILHPLPVCENSLFQKSWKNHVWFKTSASLRMSDFKIIDEFYLTEDSSNSIPVNNDLNQTLNQ